MKYFFPFLFASLLVSCSSNSENIDQPTSDDEITISPADKTIEDEVYIGFEDAKFESPKMVDLLNELKICNPQQKDLNNASEPACDPKFFHIQPFIEDVPVENAFILVIRSGVHDWPLRRVLIYQREQGKLIVVNTFVANLIATRKSKSKHEDLVLRFQDEDQNMFNCLYKWKENRYQFSAVESINESRIKAGLQDSMNVEIAKVISDNKMSS